jgi:hypothetical protein
MQKTKELPIEVIAETVSCRYAVPDNVHFLNAVSSSNQFETNVVPVVKQSS